MSETTLVRGQRMAGELIRLYPSLLDARERDQTGKGESIGRTKAKPETPFPFNADVVAVISLFHEQIRDTFRMAKYELGERDQWRDLKSMTHALPGLAVQLESIGKADRAEDVLADLAYVWRKVRKVLGVAGKRYPLNRNCLDCGIGWLFVGPVELPELNLYYDRHRHVQKITPDEEWIEWNNTDVRVYCSECPYECVFEEFDKLAAMLRDTDAA